MKCQVIYNCNVIGIYMISVGDQVPGRASLVAWLVKNPPAIQETPVRFLGCEDPLEKG